MAFADRALKGDIKSAEFLLKRLAQASTVHYTQVKYPTAEELHAEIERRGLWPVIAMGIPRQYRDHSDTDSLNASDSNNGEESGKP